MIGLISDARCGEADLIHFAGVNSVCLYTMKSGSRDVTWIDLYDLFPTSRHRYQPSIRVASLGSTLPSCLLMHEQVANILLLIDSESGNVSRIEMGGLLDSVADVFTRKNWRTKKPSYRMCADLQHEPQPLVTLYEIGRLEIIINFIKYHSLIVHLFTQQLMTAVNVLEGTCLEIHLPVDVIHVRMPSPAHWLVEDKNNR
ncbi:VWA8 [Bugula neritina]|uniref:VWA8 n=1 Tax=Bugula neritina TaxID=10212 RepID=A0A7J7JVT4_BUGNE|nr:VWA8 [Bugula neritina]